MKNKRASDVKAFTTLRELAEAVGRDIGTVCKWCKREDWPFAKKAPWPKLDAPKILRWVADTLERGAIAGPVIGTDGATLKLEKLREEIRKIRADANRGETVLSRERAQQLDADDVAREWASMLGKFRNSVQNLASQVLPLALNHGMPAQSSSSFTEQLEQACNSLLKNLSDDDDDAAADVGAGIDGADAEDAVPA